MHVSPVIIVNFICNLTSFDRASHTFISFDLPPHFYGISIVHLCSTEFADIGEFNGIYNFLILMLFIVSFYFDCILSVLSRNGSARANLRMIYECLIFNRNRLIVRHLADCQIKSFGIFIDTPLQLLLGLYCNTVLV